MVAARGAVGRIESCQIGVFLCYVGISDFTSTGEKAQHGLIALSVSELHKLLLYLLWQAFRACTALAA
ncbi:hypothetical protein [Nitrosomonas sp.]|uniref:hypothetical protein n=1 Tax=Nitrosomonas sp. TaxID=42353 RepID=UPI0037C97AA9